MFQVEYQNHVIVKRERKDSIKKKRLVNCPQRGSVHHLVTAIPERNSFHIHRMGGLQIAAHASSAAKLRKENHVDQPDEGEHTN